jgi:predicted transcriptional regulator
MVILAGRFRTRRAACGLLGEATEAEDVVQDAYLRWERCDTAVSPEAWLTKVVTNLCLDRLTPPERAVFVLREAFGHSHREVAEILDLTEPHVRQLYRRAQQHVATARKRFTAAPEQHRKLLERFLEATLDGDVPALEQMLADDVIGWADGGGKAPALRHPLVGRGEVVRNLLALSRYAPRIRLVPDVVNGELAIVVYLDGQLSGVTVPEFDGDRIVAIRTIANPDKLAFLARQVKQKF